MEDARARVWEHLVGRRGGPLTFHFVLQPTMAAIPVQSAPGPDVATTLAFECTHVAYERIMLGWVRTATLLITFGFTIYKFFQTRTYT